MRDDGTIVVQYGKRQIVIPRAHYKANGYKPSIDELPGERKGRAETLRRNQCEAFVKLLNPAVAKSPRVMDEEGDS